ncbi:MAG: hypothetical protein U0559_13015 [Anaerolineae bacterium]
MNDRGAQIYPIVFTLSLLAAMIAATLSQRIYIDRVQSPACYAYAQHKALPNLADLQFVDVVIATGRFHGHECRFINQRSGLPVSLAFDAADVPYGIDTFQALSMVVPFLIVGVTGIFTAERLRHR